MYVIRRDLSKRITRFNIGTAFVVTGQGFRSLHNLYYFFYFRPDNSPKSCKIRIIVICI